MYWKKMFSLVLMTFICSFSAKGQNYDVSVGIFTPSPSGFTYKYFVSKKNAIEIIGGIYTSDFLQGSFKGGDVTGLYEFHRPTLTEELQFFYGFGAHLGVYQTISDWNPNIGIDGIAGLEFSFPEVPIGFAFQYKPSLDFVSVLSGRRATIINGGGLSLKYLIR